MYTNYSHLAPSSFKSLEQVRTTIVTDCFTIYGVQELLEYLIPEFEVYQAELLSEWHRTKGKLYISQSNVKSCINPTMQYRKLPELTEYKDLAFETLETAFPNISGDILSIASDYNAACSVIAREEVYFKQRTKQLDLVKDILDYLRQLQEKVTTTVQNLVTNYNVFYLESLVAICWDMENQLLLSSSISYDLLDKARRHPYWNVISKHFTSFKAEKKEVRCKTDWLQHVFPELKETFLLFNTKELTNDVY